MSAPRFELDPSDLPGLLRTVRGWPGADEYPPLELRRVEVEEDAFAHLADVVGELAPEARSVLVVQDDTPMRRDGEDLKRGVCQVLADAGLTVEICELAGGADGSLHAEFERLDEVIEQLRPGVPVVALGSGTVTDLAKHACFTHEQNTGEHLPLVFCPTAISVLAYSARMAVIAKDGVKRTWPSRLSDALLFDLAALAEAPRHLTLAGFGDLAPMFTSFADWRLGDALGLARFFEPSLRVVRDVRVHFAEVAALLHDEAREGLEMLAKMNEALLGDWPRQRERLSSLLTPPEEAVRTLATAGAPLRFPEREPPVSEEEGRWAFEHAHLLRKRFNAGDLYYLLGWLDQGFSERVFARRDELVDAAAA